MDLIKYWLCLLERIVHSNGKIKMLILFIGFHTETDEHHPTFAEGLPARNRCKSALRNYWLGFKIV